MSTKYDAPHCVTSSILLLLRSSSIQILCIEPYSQTSSVYALPIMRETKFYTRSKQLTELCYKTSGLFASKIFSICFYVKCDKNMDRYISFQSFIVLKKSKLRVSSLTTWLTFITNRIRILELYKT
jgi:hypothetical protein